MAALRPLPHRGDIVASGAVPLVVAVALINFRMDPVWGTGVLLVINAVVASGLLALGLAADPEPRDTDRGGGPLRPRPYVAVLLLCGLLASYLSLIRLSQVLGANGILGSPGQTFWVTALLGLDAFSLWRLRDAAILAFVTAVSAVVSVYAFVDWVFGPTSVQTIRWIAFALILALVALHLFARQGRRREAVLMVDVAGLVAFGLAYTLIITRAAALSAVGSILHVGHVGAGWVLFTLACGLALVAFAALEREPGPGFLGVAVLAAFTGVTAIPGEGGPSLLWWPVVLLALGVAGLVVGLRPARPLPPPPPAAAGGKPAETINLPARPEKPPGTP